ncbi:MAG: hypothetical protein PHV42_02155 [Candidatus Pacebacteria bacterium]|nr:hypothetical protein [Candidatus Paceibacterota bacterium]
MKKLLTHSFLLRLGLACAFLANSLTAFLSPDDFKDAVSGSFVLKIIPVSAAAFVTFIGISDGIVAILLVLGKKVSWVALYASLWIVGVILVTGVMTFDALEHVAFLSLAVAIAMHLGDE